MRTAVTAFAALACVASASKPNVIFILADDLGYSDVACYGATGVRTPHIDRLAAEGFRFTAFRTAASICSPSRAAFLTGAYPQRCGLYMGINPNRDAHWFLGLHQDEVTLAEQFKKASYQTLMIGKWHLGAEPEFSMLKQGFDEYYGMPCNFAHSPRFFDGEEEVFARTPLERLTTLYTERITQFIRHKHAEPFFIYYAHNYPHTPYQPGPAFRGKSADGIRGDVIEEFDWSVGEVMKTLEDTGVAGNTIVIFSSDNGPVTNRYAKPFRGTKYVTFEGGHRVPFIVHWPALIKHGRVSNAHINAMDLFPTLSEIIDVPLSTARVYDGVSLMPLLRGEELSRNPQHPFFYYNCENLQAVLRGDWKLHLPRMAEQLPFWDKNKAFTGLEQPVLYNLSEDQAETRDVAADHPETVKALMDLASATRRELGEFGQRGVAQRSTGSLFPNLPVISHARDWGGLGAEAAATVKQEHQRRHRGTRQKQTRGKKGRGAPQDRKD